MTMTVGVATRDRLGSLTRCLRSLRLIADLVSEVIILDGARDPGLERALWCDPEVNALPLRVVPEEGPRGLAAARNTIVRLARNELVLNLDDDAWLRDGDGVRRAVEVLTQDPTVAVVALAQTDTAGRPWPAGSQPAPAEVPCLVPSFVGYGHLVRRRTFQSVGGYREWFGSASEEKELCLRIWDAGHRVVYLPDARVAHVADPANRSPVGFMRNTVRNNCLGAVCNLPLGLLPVVVPAYLWSYFQMRRAWKVEDPRGFRAVMGQILERLPRAWRERRPVKWSTLLRWRRLRREPEPYSPGAGALPLAAGVT